MKLIQNWQPYCRNFMVQIRVDWVPLAYELNILRPPLDAPKNPQLQPWPKLVQLLHSMLLPMSLRWTLWWAHFKHVTGLWCSWTDPHHHAPIAFNVDISLRIGLVCAYSSAMNYVFNGEVEESSTVCQQLESPILLLLKATTVIMFFLVAIERLLKILSW